MELLKIALLVVLGVAMIGLWALAVGGVNDKILDLKIRIRQERSPAGRLVVNLEKSVMSASRQHACDILFLFGVKKVHGRCESTGLFST